MLSKEKFCELMRDFETQYRKNEEWLDKLYDCLGEFEEIYNHDYMAIVIKAIEYAMGCKPYSDDTTDISWWIFEDDLGKKGFDCGYKGKKYYPNSAEELYDMIVDMNGSLSNE